MGNCPFPYLLALLAPFFIAMFRTAGKKPPEQLITPIKRRPGQYLPKQRVEAAENDRELTAAR